MDLNLTRGHFLGHPLSYRATVQTTAALSILGSTGLQGKVNKPIKYGCIIIDSVHFSMTGRYSNGSILQQIKEELI